MSEIGKGGKAILNLAYILFPRQGQGFMEYLKVVEFEKWPQLT